MTECEDCGEECRRRTRCHHCGQLVCPWCWHHVHGCQPNHSREECWDLHPEKRLPDSKGETS
jgi:hypothetical protein